MTDFPAYSDTLKERHHAEFGDAYDLLKFVSGDEAREAKAFRTEILEGTASDITLRNKRTKPVYRGISPGCELCATGSWSCLFINGKCNCRCFYCPTEQSIVGLPTTNTLTFPRVQDYVDYIEQLDFKGVSVSGGEPLITLDASLKFIAAVKKKFGDRVYLWIYTNGTLVNREILSRLRDAGLNEIRFDIGATEYSLKKAQLAVGLIDHVTVEIPAVPEEYDLLKNTMHEMSESGISFLNLHQLRLTPHNMPHLMRRNYTYLHGEHLTVLESELTALKLMRHASANSIRMAINYCSFVYKNRFQRAAARRRCSRLIKHPHEDVTENGYIRSLYMKGPTQDISPVAASLEQSGCQANSWVITKEKDCIRFSSDVWHLLPLENVSLGVTYFDSRLVSSISYRNLFKEIKLNRNRSVFAERTRTSEDMEISRQQRDIFESLIIRNEEPIPATDMDASLRNILRYEKVTPELQDYS